MLNRTVRVLIPVLLGFGLLLAAVTIARQAANAPSISDTSVTELYVRLASRGALLVGPYSRFQWHHPGPLYFYWLAPFYKAAGERSSGLAAGSLVMNVGCLALLAWTIGRRANRFLVLATGVVIAAYAWRAPESMTSAWNPHVPVVPLMALLALSADAMSGGRWALPLVAALASLIAQSHVALAPVALMLGALSVVMVGIHDRRRRTDAGFAVWIASAAVLIVCWSAPLIEQATSAKGNLTLLVQYFAIEHHPTPTLAVAVSAWSDMLTGILRPDFYVAHGWPYVESPVRWAEIAAGIQMAALLCFAARAFLKRQAFETSLAAVLLLSTLLALWSTTRADAELFDHAVFWIVAIGTLNIAVLLAVALETAAARAALSPRGALVVCWAGAGVAMLLSIGQLERDVDATTRPAPNAVIAQSIGNDLAALLQASRVSRPLLVIDQDAWEVAAGAILQLDKLRVPVAVEDDWLPMFSPVFAVNGQETAAATVAGRTEHVRLLGTPGDRLVASYDPFYVHFKERTMNAPVQ